MLQYCSKVTQAKFDEFRSLFTFESSSEISRSVNRNFDELSFSVPKIRRHFETFRIIKANFRKRHSKNRFAVEEFHCTVIRANLYHARQE